MDRRRFVVGSGAAAAALMTACDRAGGLSLARDHLHQSFSAGRRHRCRHAPADRGARADRQATVVLETKSGAAGQVGAQFAASAKPDGYTLLSHITSISGFAEVDRLFGRQPKFTKRRFHPDRAFGRRPLRDPRQRSAALQDAAGIRGRRQEAAEPDHLSRRRGSTAPCIFRPRCSRRRPAPQAAPSADAGGGPALTALLGNNSQVLVSSVSAALTQIKAGKARAARLVRRQRSKALPDVPTMKELGYDVEYYLWVGMFAPKGTPDHRHTICATR